MKFRVAHFNFPEDFALLKLDLFFFSRHFEIYRFVCVFLQCGTGIVVF